MHGIWWVEHMPIEKVALVTHLNRKYFFDRFTPFQLADDQMIIMHAWHRHACESSMIIMHGIVRERSDDHYEWHRHARVRWSSCISLSCESSMIIILGIVRRRSDDYRAWHRQATIRWSPFMHGIVVQCSDVARLQFVYLDAQHSYAAESELILKKWRQ